MNKETIRTWCFVFVVFSCLVSTIYVVVGVILDHREQATPEPVAEVRLPHNPSAIAAHVCKDRRALSGWDGACLMMIDRMVRGRHAQVDGNFMMSRDTCIAWLDMARRSYAVDADEHRDLICD